MNTLPTLGDSRTNRRFGFFNNLSLSQKLLLAFGALFVFAVIIAIITLSGSNGTQAAYEKTLAQGIEMRNLSNQLATNLSAARDNEKGFLLHWRDEGYYTAYNNYVTPHINEVAIMRNTIKQLAPFGPAAAAVSSGITTQTQYDADLASLNQNVETYEKSFTSLVDAYHKKGFDEETDYESQFRTAAVNMEYYLFFGGLVGVDPLKITYLRIRYSEKNYVSSSSDSYVTEIHTFIPLFKEQISTTDKLTPAAKTDLLGQVDTYQTAFDALVALDKQIAVYNKDLINSASNVSFLATKIDRLGEILAIDGISTARSNSSQTFNVSIITVVLVLIFTILISITFSQQLTRPIRSLTNTAKQISSGNFDVQATVTSGDEVGILAQTFNTMTHQLRGAFQNLDHRAHELEQQAERLELTSQQSEKRSQQLQTIAEIARYISTEKDLNKLLPLITQTVSERFEFYHAGIFLLDDTGTYAILLASNSPGGQKMLQRHHSLKVGQVGIVGNVTATGIPRVASDIGEDATYFNNPDLPQTRSELALPLKIEKQVIGALDIQSTEINDFSNEDVEVLTTLADQVSLAIQNARLFDESRKALIEAETISRQSTRESWRRVPEQYKLLGYKYNISGASPLREPAIFEAKSGQESGKQEESNSVAVPIELRGEVIGTLHVQSPSGALSNEQRDLVKAVADRVALSAENARLFEETTMRANRERMVSDITGKIRNHNDPQAMIETAINELRNALGATKVEVIPQALQDTDNKKV